MDHTGKREIVSVGGGLKELITITDEAGNVIHKSLRPLMLKFTLHDMAQVMVGATLIAIPVGLTEEVWRLGETLSWMRIGTLTCLSLMFMGSFMYYISYQQHLRTHWNEFLKRLIGTYLLTLLVAGVFLLVIDKAPIDVDLVLTIKRMIIVAFPASLSGAVVDLIK